MNSFQYYKQFSKDLLPYSPEEEAQEWQRALAGDQAAIDNLVLHNIFLAEKIAIEKVQKMELCSLQDDAIQVAIQGLISAVHSYNPNQGTKFSTYATHCISHEVDNALNQQFYALNVGPHFRYEVISKVDAYCRAKYEMQQNVNVDEMAKTLHLPVEDCRLAMDTIYSRNAISLSTKLPPATHAADNESELILEGALADRSFTDSIDELELKDTIRDALSCLSERNREIISLRFGLNNNPVMSLAKIGNLFGLSTSGVADAVQSSLKQMERHLTRSARDVER